jgi:hypothetical protein
MRQSEKGAVLSCLSFHGSSGTFISACFVHRVAEPEAGVIELLVPMRRAADMWIYVLSETRRGNLLKSMCTSG